jgi:AraC-like DNA-binding protein
LEGFGIYRNVRKGTNREKYGHLLYLAECSVCGETVERRLIDLKINNSVCVHQNKTYNIKNKRLKRIYLAMIERCYKTKDKAYKFYGGKGIIICKEWLDYPEKFEAWARNNGYKDNLTIDRIDGNKNYCPENCRWITNVENARDKISTRYICVNNKKLSGRQWASYLGLSVNTINKYVRDYGLENTKSFINIYKNRKKDKDLKYRESIYHAYMNGK